MNGKLPVKSLATATDGGNQIAGVELLGHDKVVFAQGAEGLVVTLPAQPAGAFTCVLKITGTNLHPPVVGTP